MLVVAQEVNKQRMSKQELPRPPLSKARGTMMEDRYYVQCITEQVFLIRERRSADEEPRPDDRLVRSFDVRHDAYMYANSVNDMQKKLDEQYGYWKQRAI